MPPDKARARAQDPGSTNTPHPDGHDGGASAVSIARPGDEGLYRAPRTRGCSCGCRSRWLTPPLGYYRDSDCVLATDLAGEVDWADGAIGYLERGEPRITSLRQWRWAS